MGFGGCATNKQNALPAVGREDILAKRVPFCPACSFCASSFSLSLIVPLILRKSIYFCSSGKYSTMSCIVQLRILHRASNVLVDTESPAFRRRMVELLMPPLT